MQPESSRINRKYIIAAVLAVLAILALLLFSTLKNDDIPYEQTEPEKAGPSLLLIENSEPLVKILLPKQFDVLRKGMDVYVKEHLSTDVEWVTAGEPSILKGGREISFKVTAEGYDSFTVELDRWSDYKRLIFTVPETQYEVKLDVYNN